MPRPTLSCVLPSGSLARGGPDMSGPPGLLLTFYGDDFTGSTDAMEALTLAGLRTVLFFSPPAPELLESRFADLSCMGVAGTSRAMSPAEMDRELELTRPPVVPRLRQRPPAVQCRGEWKRPPLRRGPSLPRAGSSLRSCHEVSVPQAFGLDRRYSHSTCRRRSKSFKSGCAGPSCTTVPRSST
jgi:hypothetical protein